MRNLLFRATVGLTLFLPVISAVAPEDDPNFIKANTKCASDSNRLFKYEEVNGSPYTKGACNARCAETPNCEYYSLVEDPTKQYYGMCIGCKSPANPEGAKYDHNGFNYYKVDSTVDPGTTQTNTDPNFIKANTKCAMDNNRLFREELVNGSPYTKEACNALCNGTPNCEYYSLVEDSTKEYYGVCIGCTSPEDPVGAPYSHNGFNYYKVDKTADPGTTQTNTDPNFIKTNTKCAIDNNRLFREELVNGSPYTKEACNELCAGTPNCEYYSLVEDPTKEYYGVCIGCTSPEDPVGPPYYHIGFNYYKLDNTGSQMNFNINQGGGSGDPHLKTWNGHKYDYHGECDMVLVDNPHFADGLGLKLHIRTTQVRHYSYIERAALKIGSDVLEFANDVNTFTINGKTLSPETKNFMMADRFHVNRLKIAVSVRLDESAKAKIDFHQRKNGMMWVNVDSGSNLNLFPKSLGLIGQYESGVMMGRDNSTTFVGEGRINDFANEWQVRGDLDGHLFKEAREPQYPRKCLPPKPKTLSSRLGASYMKAKAEKVCAKWKEEDRQDCIFDVIHTRNEESAEEAFDVEYHVDFQKASYQDVLSYVRYLKRKAGPNPNHHHHAQAHAQAH